MVTVSELRAVCAEAYQMAGALGAPVKALDNLSAAANGDPLPHTTFLPIRMSDVARQRDQLISALEALILFTKPTKTNAAALANAHRVIQELKLWPQSLKY